MQGKEGFQANGQWRCVWRVQGCYGSTGIQTSSILAKSWWMAWGSRGRIGLVPCS